MGETFGNDTNRRIEGEPRDTRPRDDRPGLMRIGKLLGPLEIKPSEVKTLRPDLFSEGHFGVFDALVHACRQHDVDIQYHFHEELLTHVIDSVDGRRNWWYAARYHGGGDCEEPAHRMDTHPHKDWTKVEVYQVSEQRIQELHAAFRAEVERLESNQHKVIVPEVTIRSRLQNLRFTDVEVKAHGLREDIFKPGEITGADVMVSLADRGDISLRATWKDHVGRALAQGYFFTRFNDEQAHGRAGFTYELGEKALGGRRQRRFGNNHFHMTSDIRIIVSPEYVRWRWTDLSDRRRQQQPRPAP